MAYYAVFVEGNNFELSLDGRKERLGFFTTVRVESPSEHDAKESAVSLIRAAPELQEALQTSSEIKPTVEAKAVHELLPENKMKSTGFTFFPMEDE